VSQDRIIIDPGLGFGKTWRDNLEVIRNLRELRTLNFPVLVGPSRKGTVSKVLGVKRDERLEGSLALVALCVAEGADAVRVHDIAPMKRAATMIDALLATETDQ
jgi:dihydropteroate synthase